MVVQIRSVKCQPHGFGHHETASRRHDAPLLQALASISVLDTDSIQSPSPSLLPTRSCIARSTISIVVIATSIRIAIVIAAYREILATMLHYNAGGSVQFTIGIGVMIRVIIGLITSSGRRVIAATIVVALAVVAGAGYVSAFAAGAGLRHGG